MVDCGRVELLVSAGITTGSEDSAPVPGVESSGADEVLPGSVSAREGSLSAEVTEYSAVESGRESLLDGMTKSGMLLCPLSGTPPSATAAVIPPARTISAAAPNAITDFFKKTPALYRLPERRTAAWQHYCTSKEVICQSIANAPVNPPAWAEVISAPMITPFSTSRCASMGTGSSSVRLTS